MAKDYAKMKVADGSWTTDNDNDISTDMNSEHKYAFLCELKDFTRKCFI